MVQQPSKDADERANNLQTEIERLELEIKRLTEGIAAIGVSSTIVSALKEREGRLQELRASLGAVQGIPSHTGTGESDPPKWCVGRRVAAIGGRLARVPRQAFPGGKWPAAAAQASRFAPIPHAR